MRSWGLIVTGVYTLILLVLIVPAAVFFAGEYPTRAKFADSLQEAYSASWLLIGVVLASQALLLFLSVDTSRKRLKPRAHILVSSAVAGILTALLMSAAICSLIVAARNNRLFDALFDKSENTLAFWAALWLLWGIVFYLYFRNSSEALTRLTSWLLKGSVLELLVAVPCHIIVRRRHDCSAPVVTSFGIAAGVAIMLLSFGPSVLFLYRKRLNDYAAAAAQQKTPA
jgi:hypothetical protein